MSRGTFQDWSSAAASEGSRRNRRNSGRGRVAENARYA
ncbi:hypothetical protein HMPREF9404_5817 [Eggerthella sp. HGA1]|nr:hypothetical protein HMPREF9404_5817 [Eggerthella sp. HGA1]